MKPWSPSLVAHFLILAVGIGFMGESLNQESA